MVKSSSLSSDLDLIREFEELKLKQKLLISSLSKKKKDDENKLMLEISSKLDFLVKIFQEANKESEDEENSELETKYQSLYTKLDEMNTSINSKFDELFEKISGLQVKVEKDIKSNSSNKMPPNPDFKVDKIEDLAKSESVEKSEKVEKKDKKSWFK